MHKKLTLLFFLFTAFLPACGGDDEGPGTGPSGSDYITIPSSLSNYEGSMGGVFDRDLQQAKGLKGLFSSAKRFFGKKQSRYIIKDEDMYGGEGIYAENMIAAYSFIGLVRGSHIAGLSPKIKGQGASDFGDYYGSSSLSYDTTKQYHGVTKTDGYGNVLVEAFIPDDSDDAAAIKADAFVLYDWSETEGTPIIFDYQDPDHSINTLNFPEKGVPYDAICFQIVYLEAQFADYGKLRMYYTDYNGRLAGDIIADTGSGWKYAYFKMGDGDGDDLYDPGDVVAYTGDRTEDIYLGTVFTFDGYTDYVNTHGIANADPDNYFYNFKNPVTGENLFYDYGFYHHPDLPANAYMIQKYPVEEIGEMINSSSGITNWEDYRSFMTGTGIREAPGYLHWESDNHTGPADRTEIYFSDTRITAITSQNPTYAVPDRIGHVTDSGKIFNLYQDKIDWKEADNRDMPPDKQMALRNSYCVYTCSLAPDGDITILELPVEDSDYYFRGNESQPNPVMQIQADVFLKSWLGANMDYDSKEGTSFDKFLHQDIEAVHNTDPFSAWFQDPGLDIYVDFVTGAFELAFTKLRWMDLNTLPPDLFPCSGAMDEDSIVVTIRFAGEGDIENSAIYYTIDGTKPEIDAQDNPVGTTLKYVGGEDEGVPLDLSDGTTKEVKAIAKMPGKAVSAVMAGKYYKDTAGTD